MREWTMWRVLSIMKFYLCNYCFNSSLKGKGELFYHGYHCPYCWLMGFCTLLCRNTYFRNNTSARYMQNVLVLTLPPANQSLSTAKTVDSSLVTTVFYIWLLPSVHSCSCSRKFMQNDISFCCNDIKIRHKANTQDLIFLFCEVLVKPFMCSSSVMFMGLGEDL